MEDLRALRTPRTGGSPGPKDPAAGGPPGLEDLQNWRIPGAGGSLEPKDSQN